MALDSGKETRRPHTQAEAEAEQRALEDRIVNDKQMAGKFMDKTMNPQSGDAAAQSVFSETGAILGECLSPILSEHKIRCVLFGGQISRSFGLMRSSFMSALHDVPTLESVSTVSDFDNATFNGLRSF